MTGLRRVWRRWRGWRPGRGAVLLLLAMAGVSAAALWHLDPAGGPPVAGLLPPPLRPDGPARVDLAGPATVTDADTIVIGGVTVRLDGVDAPEARQTCEHGGQPWACGAEATQALRGFLGGRHVSCEGLGQDRFGRTLGRCWVGGEDVNAWLVREGWAVAYTRYSWRYVPQEALARVERRGIWAGRFDTPEEWRRGSGR
jgi:endonuclease YncB( thermonuclease family)